jgi:hypothetical protein
MKLPSVHDASNRDKPDRLQQITLPAPPDDSAELGPSTRELKPKAIYIDE